MKIKTIDPNAVDVLPAEAVAYLKELAADIAATGGVEKGQSIEQAMTEAHARRQAFAQEMAEGRTDRAIKARRVLSAQIYGDALVNSTIERMERTA